MPTARTFVGRVDGGRVLPTGIVPALLNVVELFDGGPVELEIRRPKRSTKANSYYWGAVLPAIQTAYYDGGMDVETEALHEIYKRSFLPNTVHSIRHPDTGVEIEIVDPPTTTTLDQTEFSAYLEKIRAACHQVGLDVEWPEAPSGLRSWGIQEPRR